MRGTIRVVLKMKFIACSFEERINITAAETSVVGDDQYGKADGGRIVLQGRMLPCHITTSRHKNEQWVHYFKGDSSLSKKQHFRADGQLMREAILGSTSATVRRARGDEWESDVEAEGYFMCIARTPWMNYNYVGLILGASPYVGGCLERVGSITSVPSDWYEGGQMTTVTVV